MNEIKIGKRCDDGLSDTTKPDDGVAHQHQLVRVLSASKCEMFQETRDDQLSALSSAPVSNPKLKL